MTGSALFIIIPTWQVSRRWAGERFSTDPLLTNLLEECRQKAGVAAPVCLIVSEGIGAPALLGWLRPRILLPAHLATSMPEESLRAIFLHELAHFRGLDIPLAWLFAAARVVHWFNPCVYLADAGRAAFCEEAADEGALRRMCGAGGVRYGEILLGTLGSCPGGRVPRGALAIGESLNHLKRRIIMIRSHTTRKLRPWLGAGVTLIVAAFAALTPTLAGEDTGATAKKQADAAMQAWLGEIDQGDYPKSWTDASTSFRKVLTSEQWAAALQSVRSPLGKVLERKLESALYQTSVPTPDGKSIKGEFVIAQFDTSFENMKYARETVTFEKDTDGAWHASGYYIKPR